MVNISRNFLYICELFSFIIIQCLWGIFDQASTFDLVLILFIFCYYFNKFLLIKSGLNDTFSHFSLWLGFLIMSCVLLFNYYVSITKGTIDEPFIHGGDGQQYHQIAKQIVSKGLVDIKSMHINYIGYPLVLGFFYKLISPQLITGMLVSLFFALFNIILIAKITLRLTNNVETASKSILLTAICPQLLSTGIMLLKDVFLVMSVALILYGMISLKKEMGIRLLNFTSISIGIVIMFFFRTSILLVPLIIFIFLFIDDIKKSIWITPIIIIIFYFGLQLMETYSPKEISYDRYESQFFETNIIHEKVEGGTIKLLMGGYAEWPLGLRILTMPVALIIQYLNPFYFWKTEFIDVYPYYFVISNMNVIWFFWIGLLYIFIIFNFKKIENTTLQRILFISLILYSMPAFAYAGAVPRYAYPAYPLILPVCAWTWQQVKDNPLFRKKWLSFYKFMLILGLIAAMVYIVLKD